MSRSPLVGCEMRRWWERFRHGSAGLSVAVSLSLVLVPGSIAVTRHRPKKRVFVRRFDLGASAMSGDGLEMDP